MGTIAARDCLRVLELTEQVAAALLITVRQGVALRERQGELERRALSAAVQASMLELEACVPFIEDDRALEPELRALLEGIRQRRFIGE
jgi:histidine ammonia-lyase